MMILLLLLLINAKTPHKVCHLPNGHLLANVSLMLRTLVDEASVKAALGEAPVKASVDEVSVKAAWMRHP